MLRQRTLTWIKMLALAGLVSIAFASVAWGQPLGQYDDDDHYRHDEVREHGFQNGYRDGARAGQYDADRGRRFNFKNDDWEDSRGYQHWMGNKGQYKQAYREGYERGYRRTYGYDGYRDRDRDWR